MAWRLCTLLYSPRFAALDEGAQNLSISINPVKTQLKSVFEKVGVKRKSELGHAIYAMSL